MAVHVEVTVEADSLQADEDGLLHRVPCHSTEMAERASHACPASVTEPGNREHLRIALTF